MKKLITLFMLFIPVFSLNAQTTLSTGDIAIVGINSDGDDEFAFLLLKDIAAGTSIYITDKGWNDETGFYTVLGDGIWEWSTSTGLTAGTIVHIKTTNNGIVEAGSLAASIGTVSWFENNGTVISYTGDQIFLYQGIEASPVFITGIHYNVEASSSSANWDGLANSNKTSALPNQLTNGTNAIWVYGPGTVEWDNFRYKSTATTTGTPTVLSTAINSIANWDVDVVDNTPFTLNPFPFSFTVQGELPVELVSFTARFDKLNEQQNCVVLNWETATEVNNYGFEIERTSPLPSPYQGEGGEAGRGWEKVGFVEGAGNSNSVKSYSFNDNLNLTLNPNLTLVYRLKQIDLDGKFTYSKEIEVSVENVPSEFALEQNYPNPFNPVTTIKYSLPEVEPLHATAVQLKIYNLLGQEVATLVNETKPAGNYEVKFDASNLASGIYLYKLQAGEFTSTRKFILLK